MFKPGLRNLFCRISLVLVCAGAIAACSPPNPASNKDQILDDVNYYLSLGDCSDALNEITSLYNSSNTDNSVRLAMASVYACFAGFNFFNFISKATSANVSSNSFLFEFMAQEFPSTGPLTDPGDKVVESAGYGIDALMSVLNPGEVLVSTDLINTTTYNEGSLLYTDRTQDANEYMFFLSMAAMGGLENRAGANGTTGAPNSAGELSWTTSSAANMSTDGCEYASSLLNFADSIASVSESGNGCGTEPSPSDVLSYLAWVLNCATYNVTKIDNEDKSFAQIIYDACMFGCQDIQPTALNEGSEGGLMSAMGAWTAPCGSNTGCSSCSVLLRDRNNCAGTTNDQVSCSAAGLINFVNESLIGWQ